MFKPAIRLSPQDFDAINTRLDQGTRLGDYMAGDVNARDADVNYVSHSSEASPLADCGEQERAPLPPWGLNSSNIMQFFGKFWQNRMLAPLPPFRGLVPPPQGNPGSTTDFYLKVNSMTDPRSSRRRGGGNPIGVGFNLSLWPIFPGNEKELDKRGRLPYLFPPPDPLMQLMVVRVGLLTKRMILSML